MYYVGLDLHKKYITGCVLDSQGAVVAEQRRLPPVLETLLGWLAPVGQPVAVALEATLYWAWLHDRLTDRKSTRLNSSHTVISYAVFCLKKKKERLKP